MSTPPQRELPGAAGGGALPAIIDNRFEVGPDIGQGGMATVYRARDVVTGTTVAVKVMRDDIVPYAARARFAREIALTGAMRHAGILQVIAVGEVNGRPYYVMPYVEGRSLRERLADGHALAIGEAVQIAAKIGEALAYAHERSVIHRDIKPANILLNGDQPMLADFGIARAVDALTADRLTESGVALGTAHYMSPEQASGDKVDGRSDIYSLACVLYEMLVGMPPFGGATIQQVLARHATSPVPGLREVRGTIPIALEQVVLCALEKVPADRFASAEAFVTALRKAETATAGQRYARARRRPRRAVLLVGALGVAAAAALVAIRTRAPPLDPNRVLVLPFFARGAEGVEGSVGEDAATIIGAAIDGVGSLRWVDGWRLLDANQRRDVGTLSAGATSALARRVNAGYVLGGRIVDRQDTVDVVVNLLDVAGDTVIASGKASASRGEAWRAALRAVNGVLPRLMRTRAVDAGAGWQDRSPKAVAAYLQGEAAYRRLQMPLALTRFREAIGYDSLLTLAALRGAQAATWSHLPREAGELARLALRHSLSARDAHFARGLVAYVDGSADSSARELRRAIDVDSTMDIAWMQLGETYTHLLPRAGPLDSLTGFALEHAYVLDSTGGPSVYHLAERRARAGDAAGTAALLAVVRVGNPDTLLLRQIELMQRCAASGQRPVDWSADARARPLPLVLAATKLAAGGGRLACAADAFGATLSLDTAATAAADGRRFAALIGLVGVRHAQGQPAKATAEIGRFVARWGAGNSLLVRQALVDPGLSAAARAVARADSARLGADFSRSPFSNRLWLLGVWAARDGRLDAAAGAARELSRRADSTHNPRDRRYAESVLAHAAIAAHDTARAFALLTPLVGASIPDDELQWDESASMADERLLLAQLLFSRGDAKGALDVASVFDSTQPAVFLLYLTPSLELRIRAAQALGDDRLASRFRARLASMQTSSARAP
ncbi:MAG TPA: serine/threonine-protein kinase [Gemmatimonadaceae bacterium]|nr:serine/threonine-protein kinase [Gemmatimonadaceae bacterium]